MSTSVTGGVGAVRTTVPTNFSKVLKPQDCGDVGVNSGEADMQKEPRLELNDTLICELKISNMNKTVYENEFKILATSVENQANSQKSQEKITLEQYFGY